jgi:hypothetical protein
MTAFHSAREAKDFLVSQIAQQAERENVPLSEVERKMLYFTESYESLPDIMDVAEKFDAEYDQDEYEAKISRLAVKAIDRLKKESPEDRKKWGDAVRCLNKEDHYILIMIPGGTTLGLGGVAGGGHKADWRDRLKLLAAGLAVAVAGVLGAFLFQFLGLTRDGHTKWFPGIPDATRGKILVGGIILLTVIGLLPDRLYTRLWRRWRKLK